MKRSLLVCAVLFLLCANFVLAQEKKTVAGIVQDEKGLPLVGVSIQEKGATNGTLTDANGAFKISVSTEATLVFTYVGYMRQEVPLNGRVSLAMRMNPDSKGLNEIVVTALGIKRERRKLGYAISSVSGDEIVKASPTNFASALYGKAAGVKIQTAPGGATSAVTIQIRGINSITQDNQPLIVLDGVPIRKDQVNDKGFDAGDNHILGNSLLDINPANIQDVSILKGAAATALYGSDGANGVVVITTKSGKKAQGIGVDFSYSYGLEKAANLPELQGAYGPGYERSVDQGQSADGFIHLGDINGDGKEDVRPVYRAWASFGPAFDGRQIAYWDGTFKPYVAHTDSWQKFYQTGHSSIANIALSGSTDKSNYRLSFTRNDYKGVQIGGDQQKNTVNLVSSYKVNSRLSTDVSVTYVNEKVHNRPYQMRNVSGAYNGLFSPADDMDEFFAHYQTSKGYKYVMWNQTERDPVEAMKYEIRPFQLLDFMWNQLKNSYDEYSNRVLTSATLNYEIAKGLKFRGRLGNDFTGYSSENKQYTEYAVSFGPTGAYGANNNQYSLIYSDLLLSYSKQLSTKLTLNASLGYQARKEERRLNSINTDGGLTQENWFSAAASQKAIRATTTRIFSLQDGLFGILGLEYRNMFFVEGTLRRERISTLYPGKNVYYYPSVSASFELSRAMTLPKFVDYAKLRLGYGGVASPAPPYTANIVYTGATVNTVPILFPSRTYGNNDLEPQLKYETEVGLELKMFEGRLGLDGSFYHNITKGQILPLDLPTSTGAAAVWTNVGNLTNTGIEVAVNAIPYTSRNFEWSVRGTIGMNNNKVQSLTNGLESLELANLDSRAVRIVANVGSNAGDIMVYRRKKNAEGKYLVDGDGYYMVNTDQQEKVGNIQAKFVGGLGNTFRYKNWSMDALLDYRIGGQMVSEVNYIATGAGLLKKTSMFGRDAANGGLTYYEDAAGNRTLLAAGASAPAGTNVYHDGIVIDGVDETGKQNTKILQAPEYYRTTYNWGVNPQNSYEDAVHDNNYVKFRELAINYTFPVKLTSKARLQNLSVGLYGRNLFYVYKSVQDTDPEVGVGTNFAWGSMDSGTSAATRSFGANVRLSF